MKALSCPLHGVLIVITGFAIAGAAEPDAPIVPRKVIKLFNGRDLSGWTTWLVDTKREDPRGVYSVRDGMLRISGDGFGYLSTDRAYKGYRLVVEVKWGMQNYQTRKGMARDSGIFLHTVGPEGNSYDRGWGSNERNTGSDISSGAYKAAIECQVMEGGFGDLLLIHGRYADGRHVPVRITVPVTERRVKPDYAKYQFDPRVDKQTLSSGAIAWLNKDTAWQDVPGFRGRSDVESPCGEWTRIECVCAGDRVTVFVNGKHVNEAHDAFPAAGKILLQCEGSEVLFRRIELHPVETNTDDDVPRYTIRRATSPVTIDGRMDEPAWKTARSVGDFVFPWRESGKKEQTVAKMLWDDRCLYVAYRCEDALFWADHSDRDSSVWMDDCVEVFTAPNPDQPDNYFNIEMNVRNAFLDQHHPDGPGKEVAEEWNSSGIKIATTIDGTLNEDSDTDRSWILEAAIPFANFAKVAKHTPPKPGDVWHLNLNRLGGRTNPQFSQWSASTTEEPQFHAPRDFGRVVFAE